MLIACRSTKSEFGRIRKELVFMCTHCEKEFTRGYRKSDEDDPGDFHFCSKICVNASAKPGGALFIRKQETCVAKYGVENAFQSEEKKKKSKLTMMQKFGVEHHLKLEEQKEKQKITVRRLYGTDNVFQSEIVKERIKESLIKKYGANNPMRCKEVKAKFDHKMIQKKGHDTKKKNGSYGKSKTEDAFFTYLCENFGNVERQIVMGNWCIDFKVNDTYIQFDGVYWHGLDRELRMIESSKNPRDVIILQTRKRDEAQNLWFKRNELKLIRITDRDFLSGNVDLSQQLKVKDA